MLVNLCDTGPLVALFDKGDPHHARCVATLASLPDAPLLTTWPCLAEAMYLLARGFGPAVQDRF
jgi:predicted nucleic acid-binding protein